MPNLVLDKARKRKKLSKRQLAIRLEQDYKNIYRMFKPGYNPRFTQLVQIAAAMGCRVRDLIQED